MSETPKKRAGFHGHAHAHPRAAPHRHPHHHEGAKPARPHLHTHTVSFARFTYVCSPIHDLDARAKLMAAALFIGASVLSPAPRALEFAFIGALLAAIVVLARLPLGPLVARSLLVIPIAGGIAAFSPLANAVAPLTAQSIAEAYASGWPQIWEIVTKAWLSASVALLVAATTPFADIIAALEWLHVPRIFLTLLTFLSRYAGVLGSQLTSLRRAVSSRAPELRGTRLLRAYGDVSGNLFMRAYERGERVHAAMLARGYDGTLPTSHELRMRPADGVALVLAVCLAMAIRLY